MYGSNHLIKHVSSSNFAAPGAAVACSSELGSFSSQRVKEEPHPPPKKKTLVAASSCPDRCNVKTIHTHNLLVSTAVHEESDDHGDSRHRKLRRNGDLLVAEWDTRQNLQHGSERLFMAGISWEQRAHRSARIWERTPHTPTSNLSTFKPLLLVYVFRDKVSCFPTHTKIFSSHRPWVPSVDQILDYLLTCARKVTFRQNSSSVGPGSMVLDPVKAQGGEGAEDNTPHLTWTSISVGRGLMRWMSAQAHCAMSLQGRALSGVPKFFFAYMPLWGRCPRHVMSCHIPPWGAIGGYWYWPGTNGLLKWSTNIQKYMVSGPRCPCHVTSCHIMSPPVGGYWWLLVLAWGKWSAQMVHQLMYKSIWHLGQDIPVTSHHVTSCHIPPYLSNCWRYRLDLGLIGKVFESIFQILKNGISMATSLATRCKTP